MQNHFLALLENTDLISDGEVNGRRIERLSISEICDISEQAVELTSIAELGHDASAFSHTASLSLAGHPFPCAGAPCRLDRVDQLARFAALYSDRVYVHSLISRYAEHPPPSGTPLEHVQQEFFDDLRVIAAMEPLVRTGRMIPVTPPAGVCPSCLSKGVKLDAETKQGADGAEAVLLGRFEREVRYSAVMISGLLGVNLAGPEDLIEHGSRFMLYRAMPDTILDDRDLLARLTAGEEVDLEADQVDALGRPRAYVKKVMDNVVFELAVSQGLGTSLITDSALHVDLLDEITGSAAVRATNEAIRDHLTVLVPYANELSLDQLVELRNEEQETFLLFRQALTQAVEAVLAEGEPPTAQRMKQLFGDVLEPGVARLDARVEAAKSGILKGALLDAATWSGVLSFGLFSGLLPPSLLSAASTLGLGTVATSVVRKLVSTAELETPLKADNLYYLWRIKKEGSGG